MCARATVCRVYTCTHQELCVGEHHMEMLCTYKLQTSQARPSTSKGSRNEFEYSLKIVNPSKMSSFTNLRVCVWKQCESLADLRRFLDENVSIPSTPTVDITKPDLQHVQIGYIEPGDGLKGRKLWLHTDNDLQGMYEKHQGKKSIQLWCYTHVATKPQSKDTPTSSSTGAQKSSEVDEIE